MAQSLVLVPGAGAQSRRTVSMETGSLETFSGITSLGLTDRNIRGPKYSCFRGDSSSPGLGWNVALEQMHRV